MRQTLNRHIEDLEALFGLLRRFAREHALDPDTGRDLAVVAEELFTNQVRHARPGTPTLDFEIDLVDGCVRMVLTDEDVDPFDPTSAPEVDVSRPVSERRPGGLGIHFVRTLSDTFEWNYDPERRVSRITVTRQLEK